MKERERERKREKERERERERERGERERKREREGKKRNIDELLAQFCCIPGSQGQDCTLISFLFSFFIFFTFPLLLLIAQTHASGVSRVETDHVVL